MWGKGAQTRKSDSLTLEPLKTTAPVEDILGSWDGGRRVLPVCVRPPDATWSRTERLIRLSGSTWRKPTLRVVIALVLYFQFAEEKILNLKPIAVISSPTLRCKWLINNIDTFYILTLKANFFYEKVFSARSPLVGNQWETLKGFLIGKITRWT